MELILILHPRNANSSPVEADNALDRKTIEQFHLVWIQASIPMDASSAIPTSRSNSLNSSISVLASGDRHGCIV
jgi:hypothetical protein